MPERISLQQAKPAISYPHCEMREMINNKRQDNEATHHHVTRGKRRFDIVLIDVRFRAGTPVFNRQLDSHVDVNNDRDEEKNSNQPEQGAEIAEMLRLTVDPIRTEKNLQIA